MMIDIVVTILALPFFVGYIIVNEWGCIKWPEILLMLLLNYLVWVLFVAWAYSGCLAVYSILS